MSCPGSAIWVSDFARATHHCPDAVRTRGLQVPAGDKVHQTEVIIAPQ